MLEIKLKSPGGNEEYYVRHEWGDWVTIVQASRFIEWRISLHELQAALEAIRMEAEWKKANPNP